MDARTQEILLAELAKVAPGTQLREGLEYILSARTGALIVMGDTEEVAKLCNGGFDIDTPFTPQRLFELAKMDGAIVLDAECRRIRRANVHLVPDPGLPTTETGMRHRTAERVSRQTSALVVSISQRRDVISLYLGGKRVILDDIEVVLAKANQALQTLQRYRLRLDEVLERLTLLEFDDIVTLSDLAEVVSRFEMVQRVSREVSRYILALGTEGRLVRMQAEELTANLDDLYLLVLRDYSADPGPRKAAAVRTALGKLTPEQLLEEVTVGATMGLSATDAQGGEDHVAARGFRVLRRIPLLPASVVARLVERFGTLAEIRRADLSALDSVDGVGTRRARAIIEGLHRMRQSASA
ncbi:MAG: DNA integrity scanning diadenylate cyclase DisA [Actinomycetota bacterium]|nr:DNA integrity scanning diadenylate cyclase DisA [Actinomycetota bacterium]